MIRNNLILYNKISEKPVSTSETVLNKQEEYGGGCNISLDWVILLSIRTYDLYCVKKISGSGIQYVRGYSQIEAHSNSICSNQNLAGVIRIIELLGLG